MRIAKYIAHAGICSRREAESYIEEGRVKANGNLIDHPAFIVNRNDKITLDDKEVSVVIPKLFLFNKPLDVICAHKDKRHKTVFSVLPDFMHKMHLVGRLDINSEGLMLITNYPPIKTFLELSDEPRVYKVRVFGHMNKMKLKEVQKGITIDGVDYAPSRISFINEDRHGMNQWIKVTLTEGKNREVRKLMEYCGLQVNRLVRISYAEFGMGKLSKGDIEEMPIQKVESLLERLSED